MRIESVVVHQSWERGEVDGPIGGGDLVGDRRNMIFHS